MPLYRYIKKKPHLPFQLPIFVPFLLMAIGSISIIWAIWPIITFQLVTSNSFSRVVTPVADAGNLKNTDYNNSTMKERLSTGPDYRDPNVWYPGKPQKKNISPVDSYLLTISKLKIKNAMVVIAGDDLTKSLIHYGGTALPGEYGNTVIFGHSTLPQLFNPDNYKSIFSLLPTLRYRSENEAGDEISIIYNGITYTYIVTEMLVTEPLDLTPLEQRFDDSYLTLITCVPPGTYWQRLNVRAKLKSI